jgi:Smg protein
MDERLSGVLALLRERFAPGTDAAEVEAFLSSQGYDGRQIGEILALYFSDSTSPRRAPAAAAPEQQTSLPIRVIGPHERGRFAPEAWGHLLSLTSSGVLTGGELEHVIERALTHIDGRIALDDLRALMEGASYDEPASPPAGGGVTIH